MKSHTWKELKEAAMDIQQVLGINKPPLSVSIKVNNTKLDAWIAEAITLIAPGDEFRDATIQILQDEFAFEMPEWDSSGVVEEEEDYPDDPPDMDYVPDPYADDEVVEEVDDPLEDPEYKRKEEAAKLELDRRMAGYVDDVEQQPKKMVRTKPPVEDEDDKPDEEPKVWDQWDEYVDGEKQTFHKILECDGEESKRIARRNENRKEWYLRQQRKH